LKAQAGETIPKAGQETRDTDRKVRARSQSSSWMALPEGRLKTGREAKAEHLRESRPEGWLEGGRRRRREPQGSSRSRVQAGRRPEG